MVTGYPVLLGWVEETLGPSDFMLPVVRTGLPPPDPDAFIRMFSMGAQLQLHEENDNI